MVARIIGRIPVANQAEIEGFAEFMGIAGPDGGPYPGAFQSDPGVVEEFTTNYVVQVPFTPMATILQYTSWQANDPLVHYLASDLIFNGVEKIHWSTNRNPNFLRLHRQPEPMSQPRLSTL